MVNENNELLGVISEGDCIKHISDSRYHNLPMDNATVGQNMAIDVETIDGNMNVFDAARFFIERKHRRFPIVENGNGLTLQNFISKDKHGHVRPAPRTINSKIA